MVRGEGKNGEEIKTLIIVGKPQVFNHIVQKKKKDEGTNVKIAPSSKIVLFRFTPKYENLSSRTSYEQRKRCGERDEQRGNRNRP